MLEFEFVFDFDVNKGRHGDFEAVVEGGGEGGGVPKSKCEE